MMNSDIGDISVWVSHRERKYVKNRYDSEEKSAYFFGVTGNKNQRLFKKKFKSLRH